MQPFAPCLGEHVKLSVPELRAHAGPAWGSDPQTTRRYTNKQTPPGLQHPSICVRVCEGLEEGGGFQTRIESKKNTHASQRATSTLCLYSAPLGRRCVRGARYTARKKTVRVRNMKNHRIQCYKREIAAKRRPRAGTWKILRCNILDNVRVCEEYCQKWDITG
ncbi:hypothetical protein EVAR_60513_1 [Eumeta japonica]|uniref:Uncharacterized protein n=1 Tax=Eumeta variegata TaxID=151549 RepID=A0A4C1ZH93_EUMVA|nr:hypothetical protein EVAR_60513_1 [Eumeta japonica]